MLRLHFGTSEEFQGNSTFKEKRSHDNSECRGPRTISSFHHIAKKGKNRISKTPHTIQYSVLVMANLIILLLFYEQCTN